MVKKKEFQLEYIIKASPGILFTFLSSPSAMAQWFADSVDINDDIYTFVWGKSVEYAKVIEQKENEFIRYSWEHTNEDDYFEFQIQKDDITGDTALLITDYASEGELEDQKLLWDSQIKQLMERIGS